MYVCKNAVALFTFNRPDYAMKVFNKIKEVKPPKLYLVSDGPRNDKDLEGIKECRNIKELIDWDCEVICVFSEDNLGCKKRIITGIDYIFNFEKQIIILEDDCVPTEGFFIFMDNALEKFASNDNVGIISGSNLLQGTFEEEDNYINGFSSYINCWGWATWKRTWVKFDSFLSIQEVNKNFYDVTKNTQLSFLEKKYWLNIFRHSIYTRTIWDFYLQYFFFKYNMVSVYPQYNLVYNVGFNELSTHTNKKPKFVDKSKPLEDDWKFSTENIQDFKKERINHNRDKKVIRIIYGFSIFSNIKLFIGNLLRYIGIRR